MYSTLRHGGGQPASAVTLSGGVRMGRRQRSLEPVQAWRQLRGGDDGLERRARSDDSRPGALGRGVAIRQYRRFLSLAATDDALEVMIPAPAHSDAELRFVSIGVS